MQPTCFQLLYTISAFNVINKWVYYNNHHFRNPPKIVTKDGNLVLKAGEDGDIVFEPGQGKQVFIGGNVLVRSSK